MISWRGHELTIGRQVDYAKRFVSFSGQRLGIASLRAWSPNRRARSVDSVLDVLVIRTFRKSP